MLVHGLSVENDQEQQEERKDQVANPSTGSLPPPSLGRLWGRFWRPGTAHDVQHTATGTCPSSRQAPVLCRESSLSRGDSRVVPAHPELTRFLREHLDKLGTSPDGRLFGGVRGSELPTITYRRAWIKRARRL